MHQGPHQWNNIDKLGYFQALFKRRKQILVIGKNIMARERLRSLILIRKKEPENLQPASKTGMFHENGIFCMRTFVYYIVTNGVG